MGRRPLYALLLFTFMWNTRTLAAETSRGLFVCVLQDPPVLSSREGIKKLVEFAKEGRVRTLFVQIYRGNQAWFPSKAADSSPYDECFQKLSEDPLAFLIKEAHTAGLEAHAWVNLLSLGANEKAPLLKKYGPGILTRNRAKKRRLKDYKIDGQYFLEPGDPRVRRELLEIVGEIASAYPGLDGIQFDYIRYPDLHPHYGYTEKNMERFKKASGLKMIREGSREWSDWKRRQVTSLLELLANKARAIRPGIQVSATALAPYSRANLEAFQDWRAWLETGAVDFITLMCYNVDTPRFERYLRDAEQRAGGLKKINVAVGAYALAASPETFRRQFDICESSKCRSCVVLHYGSLMENPKLKAVVSRLRARNARAVEARR